jgi:aryl-alcohol dehydrogenase-like predicted oxidoreductase
MEPFVKCEEISMAILEKNAFGKTGLQVTRLGLGAAQVGQARVSEKEAEALLNGVLDAGVNLIDTARGYGKSEERIGKYIAHRREEYVLSTKVGYDVEGHENWTLGAVTDGIERALRLLKTDVLDIVHLHSCTLDDLKRGEVIEGLTQARQAGKIKVAAYSGENEALAYAVSCGAFQSVQFSLNLCDQQVIDKVLEKAVGAGLGVIAKRPLANVFWQHTERPSGAYAEEYWHRAQVMGLQPPEGLAWMSFALRFSVFTPGVHTAITGTGSLAHFLNNLHLLEAGPLSENEYEAARSQFLAHDQDWIGQT